MSEQIKMNLAICERCGDPVMILRGGYLRPEELANLGLKPECEVPEPGTRVHEFKNPAQTRVKYAEYLKGLKPHYETAYGVLPRSSKDCGRAVDQVLVEITGCLKCEKFIAIASRELQGNEATALNLIPTSGHVPLSPGLDMPPDSYQYKFVIEDEFKDDPDPDVRGAATYLQAHDSDHKQHKRLRITRLAGQPYHVEWLPYDYGAG